MHLILKRHNQEAESQTNGTLHVLDANMEVASFHTLEPAWQLNKRNVSCIPQGVYKCVLRKSDKYDIHLHITGVKNRSLILIHFGNFRKNTKGCLIPGKHRMDINGDGISDVTHSKDAMEELLALVTPECFDNGFIYLTVT